ncbi:MAG: malonyl-[acyl-carrier protein] O-methyltransferase BioC [Gammaproteobacteria bacterium RBG_16_51_14]|nr:MAG: malonyl-[acyl-carrier protein] O-methyltransferase BioC [Gammaproteobacteria bacterium RBG_16_51_14]
MNASNDYAFTIDKQEMRQAFDAVADGYEEHAVLQNTVMQRVLERLDLINLQVRHILDLGSGTGTASRLLAQRYNKAQVIQLDVSTAMLRISRARGPRFFSRQGYLCADAEMLPVAGSAVDLVFSSLMLQWCNDLDAAFAEAARVLRPGGLFIFATLGPDTLRELRASWAGADNKVHVNAFMDMHDVGDALIRAGLADPVLDVERLTLTYDDGYRLMRELKYLGAHNVNVGRRKTLTGKRRMLDMLAAYEQFRQEGRLPATYEVVYGHAWMLDRTPVRAGVNRPVSIPVASIRRRRSN